jgi:hypothetical protein
VLHEQRLRHASKIFCRISMNAIHAAENTVLAASKPGFDFGEDGM